MFRLSKRIFCFWNAISISFNIKTQLFKSSLKWRDFKTHSTICDVSIRNVLHLLRLCYWAVLVSVGRGLDSGSHHGSHYPAAWWCRVKHHLVTNLVIFWMTFSKRMLILSWFTHFFGLSPIFFGLLFVASFCVFPDYTQMLITWM